MNRNFRDGLGSSREIRPLLQDKFTSRMRRAAISMLLWLIMPALGVAQNAPSKLTQSASDTKESSTAPQPLILQEGDGDRFVRRFGRNLPFTIKVDEQFGKAQDFLVLTEIMPSGDVIPFHMHHNAEEILMLEEGGATVTIGDKRAAVGPRSIVFIPRETWVSVTNDGKQSIHLYALFSRQGFERYLRAASVPEGQPVTPLGPEDVARLRATGHATYWDTSKGSYPPGVAQSALHSSSEATHSSTAPYPLILQEGDGEHRVGRPSTHGRAGLPFIFKVDEENGNAQDFLVLTNILSPGEVIPFHMHHNAEEVVILEEGGATVTVGDKRAEAGPRSIVFIPQDTWVSIANNAAKSIHMYGIFSRQGFERYFRAASVPEGQSVTPLSAEELARLRDLGLLGHFQRLVSARRAAALESVRT